MDKTAQELASKGRYGDSMLVHMAPEEVAGIASLGGVSTNPETGLPEMFKFKDFMKFAAPIGLSIAMPYLAPKLAAGAGFGTVGGGGLAGFLGNAAGRAIMSGVGTAVGGLLTGSNKDEALSSGLTAGLTYGLASKTGQAMKGTGQTVTPDPTKTQVITDPSQSAAINQANVYRSAPSDKVFTGIGADPRVRVGSAGTTGQKPGFFSGMVDKLGGYGNVVPGALAATAGTMIGRPEEEEERRRKRKEIELAGPYTQPVSFPGAGYGSGEYSYFGPNYGLYAKEGGHIKQMQEGGAVDTTTGADIPVSAFSGDLMSFAPAIAGGANYGIGAMPTAMDSSEYNYGVAPNMGGYDYRSFVPADYQSPVGIGSAPSVGTGEQVTGDPNVLEDIKKKTKSAGVGSFKPYTKWTSVSKLGMRANDPARTNRMFRDVVSGYTASGEPIYTRETKYKVAGTGMGQFTNPAKYKYGTMPIKFQEGGITSLPQTEGQVDGNGDGMSDEVYGDIENQQEVALSKDEFIVPADVVSGLGNGSSNAGASKLYEMMARVRKARTGKETQPEEIEAEEFMPA
jgi:hypothetical protein